jgi:hypothetical protein
MSACGSNVGLIGVFRIYVPQRKKNIVRKAM